MLIYAINFQADSVAGVVMVVPGLAQSLITLLGMFSAPMYGGNHESAGWQLIGFEDRHAFEPPFGYYDRDYPGFIVEPGKPA